MYCSPTNSTTSTTISDHKKNRKTNAWTEHVKKFAQDNNITYKEATKNSLCKELYHGIKSNNPIIIDPSTLPDTTTTPTNTTDITENKEIKVSTNSSTSTKKNKNKKDPVKSVDVVDCTDEFPEWATPIKVEKPEPPEQPKPPKPNSKNEEHEKYQEKLIEYQEELSEYPEKLSEADKHIDPLVKEVYSDNKFDPVKILRAVYFNPSHIENWNVACKTVNRNKVIVRNGGIWSSTTYDTWFTEFLKWAIIMYYRNKNINYRHNPNDPQTECPLFNYLLTELKENGDLSKDYKTYYNNVKFALNSFYTHCPEHYS